MKKYKIANFSIYKGNADAEPKYRKELSKIFIDQLGAGPYSDHHTTRRAVTIAYDFFCDKFVTLCRKEDSLKFFQFVLSQHEHTVEVALFAEPEQYPDGIDKAYIALYRRILKWILEQACDISLKNQEKTDQVFLDRALKLLNELWFVGDMIFTCAYFYAEQDMIEDVMEIAFNEANLYVFNHKHHYDSVVKKIQQSYGAHSFKHVVDETAVQDLSAAVERCFGVKYEFMTAVINKIHKINEPKGGQYVAFGWESLPLSVESMFGGNPDQARILFKGLTLNRNNKLHLRDLACKPQTMQRYLYRPIIVWNIEGADFAIIGINGFKESIIQLSTNCIPWGKAPEEWMSNPCFKAYVHGKEDEHDKWLDDEVEKRIASEGLFYHRNIHVIHTKHGSINLDQTGAGEIDFIIVNHPQQTIHVVDCKHLQGRYDMMTQKNDFSNFTKNKGYNDQIKRKVDFISNHLDELYDHHRSRYGNDQPTISKYKVEGFFIINTPTFYMFNSDYRIYTIDVFVEMITKRLADPELTVLVDQDNQTAVLNITYPYFRKPVYKPTDYLNSDEGEFNID